MENKRIYQLDIVRGICVFMMCIDHLMSDLTSYGVVSNIIKWPFNDFTRNISKVANWYMTNDYRIIIRYIFLFIFFALVGINNTLSKNNSKRGLKLFSWAIALTVFTMVLALVTNNNDNLITFGVLHAISLSILTYSIVSKYVSNKYFYLITGVLLCALSYYNSYKNGGYIGLSFTSTSIFEIVYRQMIGEALFGLDTFSYLSVLGQSFIGVFISKQFISKIKPKKSKEKFFTYLSKHSLFSYFASQLVFVIIIVVVSLLFGSRFYI